MPGNRRRERYTMEDDDDDDDAFCRACVDFSDVMGSKPKTHPPGQDPECPLDKNELGRATWGFLHTMAAYYPRRPSPPVQTKMRSFIQQFADFYPCVHCAADFRDELAKSPPAVQSRDALSRWFCEQHNIVNVKIGKPEFDCSRVHERWRDGWKDGSCDAE